MKGRFYLAEERGFCSGVQRAINLVSKAVREGPFPVRVLHEIVHNENVVREFSDCGVEFYDTPDPAWKDGTLIPSAHGVGDALEQTVRAMPLSVIDATCPLVKRLHAVAADLENQGYFILMAGKRDHRETEGVVGRLKKQPVILENTDEAELFRPEPCIRYAVISQTTLSTDEYGEILSILKGKIPDLFVAGGICQATNARQAAVKKLAEKCHRIIVIGSTRSSNSKRLREVAEKAGAEAILIPDAESLPEHFFEISGDVGITSGASAPDHLIQALIRKFRDHGWIPAD